MSVLYLCCIWNPEFKYQTNKIPKIKGQLTYFVIAISLNFMDNWNTYMCNMKNCTKSIMTYNASISNLVSKNSYILPTQNFIGRTNLSEVSRIVAFATVLTLTVNDVMLGNRAIHCSLNSDTHFYSMSLNAIIIPITQGSGFSFLPHKVHTTYLSLFQL